MGTGVDDAADLVEGDGEAARRAGDHGIGVAAGDHAGAEYVAVLVDQALAVAGEETRPLQPAVQEVGIALVVGAEPRVVDLRRLRLAEAERVHRPAHPLLAADQHRRAEARVAEGERRADHALLLALGEDDAARVGAHALQDELQARRRSEEHTSELQSLMRSSYAV